MSWQCLIGRFSIVLFAKLGPQLSGSCFVFGCSTSLTLMLSGPSSSQSSSVAETPDRKPVIKTINS